MTRCTYRKFSDIDIIQNAISLRYASDALPNAARGLYTREGFVRKDHDFQLGDTDSKVLFFATSLKGYL